ncbi:MAG: hypothetical protein RL657_1180, partial [Pseudomonadota bacterium]
MIFILSINPIDSMTAKRTTMAKPTTPSQATHRTRRIAQFHGVVLGTVALMASPQAQERASKENYPRQQVQTSSIDDNYVAAIINNVRAPQWTTANPSSDQVKKHMQVLYERNTLCRQIWISGNPDVRLSQWTQEQKQRFVDVCTDTDKKAREFQQWSAANLKNLELSEAKAAQDRYAAQVRDFMSVQPNITMVVKKTDSGLSVTRKLDRSIAIENRSNRPIPVDFVEIYDPNVDSSLIGRRFNAQSAYVKSEIERRVTEITKNLDPKLSVQFSKTVKRVSSIRDINGFALVDDLQLKALEAQIQSGDILVVSSFKAAEMMESAKAAQASAERKAAEDARMQAEMAQTLSTSPNDFSAAILINASNTRSVCMVQRSETFPIRGYRVSKEFNDAAGTQLADSFQVLANNLDELFKSIQNKQCHALILQNADMQKLLVGIKDLKIDYRLTPSKSALELSHTFVLHLGFKDFAQYQLAQTIGTTATGINRLADLGV